MLKLQDITMVNSRTLTLLFPGPVNELLFTTNQTLKMSQWCLRTLYPSPPLQPVLAKGPDYDHKSDDFEDVIDYDDPANNPFVTVPSAPRKSGRDKVMSSAGAASAASLHDSYYFAANVLQSIITSAPDPSCS